MNSAGLQYQIHSGFWTNWSYGPILGKTLTVTRSDGAFIIALVAFFAAIIGSQIWRIICFVLHALHSSSQAEDAIHNQRQAILRNSSSPIGTAWELLQMCLAWEKARGHRARPYRRILPTLCFALVIAAASIVASVFSSQVSLGSEVIIRGDNCGYLNESAPSMDVTVRIIRPQKIRAVEMAANHAELCYGDEMEQSDCNLLARPSLPFKHVNNATCPFDPSVCLSNDSNIYPDTGLMDSHWDLGMNAPEDERFQYRRTLHCAPLKTDGFKLIIENEHNKTVVRYKYGNSLIRRDTEAVCNCTFTAPAEMLGLSELQLRGIGVGSEYELSATNALFLDGAIGPGSNFTPIKELNRTDGDVYLVSLSVTKVGFFNKSEDLWYRATTPADVLYEDAVPLWQADEHMWPLGCVSQHQVCIPAPFGKPNCTQIAGRYDTHSQVAWILNDDPTHFARYIMRLYSSSSIGSIVSFLGSQSLASRFGITEHGVQVRLEPNQWQLDVRNLFSISLAALQFVPLELAAGHNPSIHRHIVGPSTPTQERMCQNQKINSTDYMSFSLFGLLFITCFGFFAILLSIVMEPLASWLQPRLGLSPYSRMEWKATEKLQLQRLAHEGQGFGQWKLGFLDVPLTEPGESLAALDMTDLKMPRLAETTSLEDGVQIPKQTEKSCPGLSIIRFDFEDESRPISRTTAGESGHADDFGSVALSLRTKFSASTGSFPTTSSDTPLLNSKGDYPQSSEGILGRSSSAGRSIIP